MAGLGAANVGAPPSTAFASSAANGTTTGSPTPGEGPMYQQRLPHEDATAMRMRREFTRQWIDQHSDQRPDHDIPRDYIDSAQYHVTGGRKLAYGLQGQK